MAGEKELKGAAEAGVYFKLPLTIGNCGVDGFQRKQRRGGTYKNIYNREKSYWTMTDWRRGCKS